MNFKNFYQMVSFQVGKTFKVNIFSWNYFLKTELDVYMVFKVFTDIKSKVLFKLFKS